MNACTDIYEALTLSGYGLGPCHATRWPTPQVSGAGCGCRSLPGSDLAEIVVICETSKQHMAVHDNSQDIYWRHFPLWQCKPSVTCDMYHNHSLSLTTMSNQTHIIGDNQPICPVVASAGGNLLTGAKNVVVTGGQLFGIQGNYYVCNFGLVV
jgi:hypothetical protein